LEAALAGATIVGISELIKDKAAVSSKLAATKVNVSATAKAKFTQRQALRTESSRRISSIAEGKVATRISQKVSSFKVIREIPSDGPASQFSSKKQHPPCRYLSALWGVMSPCYIFSQFADFAFSKGKRVVSMEKR
jgi:hypothetical protein